VIGLIIASEGDVLTVTENGYGKRTLTTDFPRHGRGGQGVIAIQTSGRNGKVVGAIQVRDTDEVILVSHTGVLIRTPVAQISVQGRNTQGVRLIKLDQDERLVAVERVAKLDGEAADLEDLE
jgi:DNA gyrase subunit A